MLIPLLGAAPAYLPYFVASAARTAPLVDWLVFHEHLQLPWEQKQLPRCVQGFAELELRGVRQAVPAEGEGRGLRAEAEAEGEGEG